MQPCACSHIKTTINDCKVIASLIMNTQNTPTVQYRSSYERTMECALGLHALLVWTCVFARELSHTFLFTSRIALGTEALGVQFTSPKLWCR